MVKAPSLKGRFKLALVTGASSGLGRSLATALAQQGISLIIVARDLTALESLAASLPVSVQCLRCDLSDPLERKDLIALIHEKTPDLLINNAGFGLYGPVLTHPSQSCEDMLSVNASAAMELSIAAASALRARNYTGTILNISSAAAFFPYPTFCVYAATKAFVNHFSRGFDVEMKPYGIRVLVACPGQIATPFREKAAQSFPQTKETFTLPVDKVVFALIQQIERGTALKIIDWRYRLALFLGRCLPSSLRSRLLISGLKSRYPSS